MATRVSFSDDLKNTDYSDKHTVWFDTGTYDYSFHVSGGGRASLKMEQSTYPGLTESGHVRWNTIEDKQKVTSGSTLKGSVSVGKSFSDAESSDLGEIKITFSREFLGKGVEYTFTMEKR